MATPPSGLQLAAQILLEEAQHQARMRELVAQLRTQTQQSSTKQRRR